jgi:hypothetical protein
LKRGKGKKRLEKIKFILFGSLKKILTFALPTIRKGKKDRNGGCRKGNKTRLKRPKHGKDEQDFSELRFNDIKASREVTGHKVLKRDVNVA